MCRGRGWWLAVARWNEVWLCVANSDKNPWLRTTLRNTIISPTLCRPFAILFNFHVHPSTTEAGCLGAKSIFASLTVSLETTQLAHMHLIARLRTHFSPEMVTALDPRVQQNHGPRSPTDLASFRGNGGTTSHLRCGQGCSAEKDVQASRTTRAAARLLPPAHFEIWCMACLAA
jgi:hypothetical protein